MRVGIAVWSTVLPEANERKYVEVLQNTITASASQHTFILITDKAEFRLPAAAKMLQVPLVTSFFGLRRWYSSVLPALIKKEAIDALITINSGLANTLVLQLPVFIAPAFAQQACNTWLQFLYRKHLAKNLQKASSIGIMASLQLQEMKKLYGIKEAQVFTVGYAVSAAYHPVDGWKQRETFLQNQTGGKEYFLYTGAFAEEGFLQVLKAFSLFKKRQQSNMQLLVPGQLTISKKLQEKIDTYKYRQDVQLLNNPDESVVPQLMACAYAVLFTPEKTITAQPVAAAMQCQIPVIGLESNEAAKEVAGAAALYASATPESLAEQMKQVYKDENLRQRLVLNAQQQAQLVNGRQAAEHILTRLLEK